MYKFLVLLFLIASCSVNEQEDESNTGLFVPDDLKATLWAESPMFYNPTNMDVDYRGRIWITEAVNYRNFNNDSTKALHHAKGDRVMILEDTDGDGRADASKVFVQDKDLLSPLGIAVIGNKVYVSCSPNLIVYTDEDGDDVPDEKEVFLTGFGGLDHDHSLHSVVGGMDGNLYFNTGNAGPHVVTDKNGWTLRSGSVYTGGTPYNLKNQGNMKSDDGKVWVGGLALRIRPDGTDLTVLAHNFRNAYELYVDSRGDMWQNDNDDQVVACRTSWLMEKGNAGYFSSDGTRYWQADQRPWQEVFTAHWHQDDPGVMPAGDNAGAGSPTGVVVNEGDALGERYRGMLFSADAGRNVVFGYHPRQRQSGYDLGRRRNFITSLRQDNVGYVWNDSASNAQAEKWFRPSDVAIGTDGALYIADWYDPVVGGHQMRDSVGYGRIYRIAPKDKTLRAPELDLSTITGQISALRNPAVNVRHTALAYLRTHGAAVIPQVKELLADENPWVRARAIWLLSLLEDEGVAEVIALLGHDQEDSRRVAFRALRQADPDHLLAYARKLMNDPSPFVRREVITALADVPFDSARNILLELVKGFDGTDRWYLESLGTALDDHAGEIYPELLARFNGTGTAPGRWDPRMAALAWRLHPPEAVGALKARASSAALSEKERSDAITALAFIKSREAVKAMFDLAKDTNPFVAEQASYWLTFRQGNDWYALWDWKKSDIDLDYGRKLAAMKVKRNRILDPQMPLNERKWNTRDMARDPVGVHMLLEVIADGRLPDDLYAFAEEQVRGNGDPAVQIRADGLFRNTREGAAISVSAVNARRGDAAAGKKVFASRCAACHRIGGTGGEIGPDLTAIGSKYDRPTLLEAIINPDAGIVFGYEAWTISLSDGRTYFGFLLADGERTVTVRDLNGKNHVIDVSLIRSRKKQEGSLMPQPSALGLSEQEIADVGEYLAGIKGGGR